ncbi:MAG: ADP compounds hydrolase NudE [Pseudomonadota bacterium]
MSPKTDPVKIHPEIRSRRIVARSRLFAVEELEMRFSNGVERTYERLLTPPIPAVLVVPLLDPETVLLIREYGAGVERYELSLPKGARDAGESVIETANRELMEECGYGARTLEPLTELTLSPGYMGHRIVVVLAEDLYPQRIEGDEPEPIEVVPWPLADIDALVAREDFSEARSLAALYLVRDRQRRKGIKV